MSQPIPLEDFVALAITLGLPVRGSQSKVTKFLDDQVRVTYPGEMIFGSDPEYAGSSFPGSCKREPSLGSTFFLFSFMWSFPTYASCTLPALPSLFYSVVLGSYLVLSDRKKTLLYRFPTRHDI